MDGFGPAEENLPEAVVPGQSACLLISSEGHGTVLTDLGKCCIETVAWYAVSCSPVSMQAVEV